MDALAQRHGAGLRDQVRSTDFVFRYRPDALLVLLAELNADDAQQVADKILRKLAEAHRPPGAPDDLSVALSMGVAPFDGHPDPLHLMQRADAALDQARAEGPNRLRVAD